MHLNIIFDLGFTSLSTILVEMTVASTMTL